VETQEGKKVASKKLLGEGGRITRKGGFQPFREGRVAEEEGTDVTSETWEFGELKPAVKSPISSIARWILKLDMAQMGE